MLLLPQKTLHPDRAGTLRAPGGAFAVRLMPTIQIEHEMLEYKSGTEVYRIQ
jgi:hypothetical protein